MRSEELDSRAQALHEHLAELRKRLINCLLIVFVATLACYGFSEKIFNFVRAPIQPYLPSGGLIFTGPLDKFIAHLKLAVVCGVIISCPFLLYQIWKFVAPGLYAKERRYTVGFIVSGTVLFLVGVAFSYWIALPMAFQFLMTFGGDIDKPMISIDQYMGFFTQMCIVFGLAFEMPLVIVILGMMGVVSQALLRRHRRYAIMTIAVIAAVVTPPDLLSMVLMLGPMWFLYEVAVILVGFFEKKRRVSQLE